jgi:hypothetical protein
MSLEAIEVTARFDEHGTITPIHFSWQGGVYRVESTGRRWTDAAGQHILVMVSNGHIYELTFKSGEGRWYIGQSEPRRRVV